MPETRIPLFPLGLVLLPEMLLPLHIFEERYKRMISECLAGDRPFGIVWFDGKDIRTVGCTARVVEVLHRYEDGRMDILTRGEARFVVREMFEEKAYMEARVSFFDDAPEAVSEETASEIAFGRKLLKDLADSGEPSDHPEGPSLRDPGRLAFAIAAVEGFTPAERQVFLEMTSGGERLKKCVEALGQILERRRLTHRIRKIIGGNGRPPHASVRKRRDDLP
jgi:Lon protease-like protein